MALAACREALKQAGKDPADDPRSIGLVLGTGAGGIDFTLDQAKIAYEETPAGERNRNPSLWTITNATHGNLAGELSIQLGLKGPSHCVSDGCASASDAVGLAMDILRSGRPGTPSAMVVVGSDAHVRWETLLGMELLGVISTVDPGDGVRAASEISRPFDRDRSGFVLSEGAWAVVIERADVVGARSLATLDGFGATCDAYHRVRPEPDMTECARAMRLAIEDAGYKETDVSLVHYHGTATELNDKLETLAVRTAFGDHADALIGTSVKSMIGHPQGASGLASLVASVACGVNADGHSDGAFVPPTINLDAHGEGCDLDFTPQITTFQTSNKRVCLVNCLAFGAKNASIIVTLPETT